jgi:1-acyl-sn-glycerol-3-phosphate acyltransferase
VIAALFRALVLALVRLYYPARVVAGGAAPSRGPVLFVANHPNALLDPLVVRLAVRRPVRFLAKSTLFGNPLGRFALGAFGALPVHRARDADGSRDAREEANERTFAACRARLAEGEALAIFPEGTSHSDPELRPLRTGAARIALSAEAERGFRLGLRIVPVGLHYEAKTTFRSRVLAVIGAPITVSDFEPAWRTDERGAVRALTDRIGEELDRVVLQADTRVLLEGVWKVARASLARDADPAAVRARAAALLDGHARLAGRDAQRVRALEARAGRYVRALARAGIADPWALEGRVGAWAAVRAVLGLTVLAPAALVGAVLGWIPYRLAGRLARAVVREEDVLGTAKLLGGALLLVLAWTAEAAAVGAACGWAWAPLALVLAAVCGWVALLWDELAVDACAALTARRVRSRRLGVRLAKERAALATLLEEALRDAR